MKHSKLIAALATAGGLFAMSSAHAFVPAAAAAIGALAGAAVGAASTPPNPPAVAVVPAPSVAVVPDTVVMGGPPATVEEVIPAPQDGYSWDRGHYEFSNGVSTWVPGHWVSNSTVIVEPD